MSTHILFPLGQIIATPGALAALEESRQQPIEFLRCHARGDWGTIHPEDRQTNEEALRCGSRLLSAYLTSQNEKIWIITEADRTATTILLPDEY
jgi:hypothetical protein